MYLINMFEDANAERALKQLVSTAPDAELVAKVCDFGVSINSSSAALGRKVDCPRNLSFIIFFRFPAH